MKRIITLSLSIILTLGTCYPDMADTLCLNAHT